jgi:hypothetical protein
VRAKSRLQLSGPAPCGPGPAKAELPRSRRAQPHEDPTWAAQPSMGRRARGDGVGVDLSPAWLPSPRGRLQGGGGEPRRTPRDNSRKHGRGGARRGLATAQHFRGQRAGHSGSPGTDRLRSRKELVELGGRAARTGGPRCGWRHNPGRCAGGGKRGDSRVPGPGQPPSPPPPPARPSPQRAPPARSDGPRARRWGSLLPWQRARLGPRSHGYRGPRRRGF